MMWISPAPVSYSERSSESWHHGDFGQHQAGAGAAAAAIVVGADGTTYFGGAAEYQPVALEELLYADGSQYPILGTQDDYRAEGDGDTWFADSSSSCIKCYLEQQLDYENGGNSGNLCAAHLRENSFVYDGNSVTDSASGLTWTMTAPATATQDGGGYDGSFDGGGDSPWPLLDFGELYSLAASPAGIGGGGGEWRQQQQQASNANFYDTSTPIYASTATSTAAAATSSSSSDVNTATALGLERVPPEQYALYLAFRKAQPTPSLNGLTVYDVSFHGGVRKATATVHLKWNSYTVNLR